MNIKALNKIADQIQSIYSTENFILSINASGEIKELTQAEQIIKLVLSYTTMELGYGGMIVLSTDVNVGGKGPIDSIKNFAKTTLQRWFKSKMVDKEIMKYVKEHDIDTGWSIGNLFKGRYFSPKTNDKFSEKSFSVDIRGTDFEFVKDMAALICKRFNQESVLVVDHKTGMSQLLFA